MTGRVLVLPAHRMEAQCLSHTLEQAGIPMVGTDDRAVAARVMLGFPDRESTTEHGQPADESPLLVLVSQLDPAAVRRAHACGAAGLMESSAPTDALVDAVQALRRGELRLPALGPEAGAQEAPDLAGLTDREREIVSLLADGAQNREIADALGISYHTVRTHVHHVMAKLGVSHRHAVAAWAHRALATARRNGETRTGT